MKLENSLDVIYSVRYGSFFEIVQQLVFSSLKIVALSDHVCAKLLWFRVVPHLLLLLPLLLFQVLVSYSVAATWKGQAGHWLL